MRKRARGICVDNLQQLMSEVHRRDLDLPSPAPNSLDFQLEGLDLSDDEDPPKQAPKPQQTTQTCPHN